MSCSECRFCDRAAHPVEIGQYVYTCRWGPPQSIAFPTTQGLQVMSRFPVVSAAMSCHRHEPLAQLSLPV